MPVEIEFKYVLDPTNLEELLKDISTTCVDIKHVYLEKGIRFRSLKQSSHTEYEFTYKTKIEVGHLEINKHVSEDDFNLALMKSRTILHKKRYIIDKKHKWEIDFFIDDEMETYFCMMECEVSNPDIIPDINELPEFIRERIIKNVVLDDQRYSSYNISNVDYAKHLLISESK